MACRYTRMYPHVIYIYIRTHVGISFQTWTQNISNEIPKFWVNILRKFAGKSWVGTWIREVT